MNAAPYMMLRSLAGILTIGLFLTLPAAAQTPDPGETGETGDGMATSLLRLPGSTRAMAMGNAFVFFRQNGRSRWRDVDAVFYHPGGIVGASGVSVGVDRLGGAASAVSFAAGKSWGSGNLAVGMRAISAAGGTIVVSATYARRFMGFRTGLTVKLIDERASEATSVLAFDVGVVRGLGPVTLGLTGRNIGSDPAGGVLTLPTDLTFGVSTTSREIGPLDLVTAFAVTYREDGEVVPGGGLELSWWPISGRTFFGRIGMQRVVEGGRSAIVFGIGFAGDSITVEYGFQDNERADSGHRFGLTWR